MNQVLTGPRGQQGLRPGLTILALTLATTVANAGLPANTHPIYSDQSSTIPTTDLLSTGDVQVETSVARTDDGSGLKFLRAWSTPTLVRFGMQNYELRVATEAYSHVRTYSAVNSGISDMALGIKGIVPQTWDKDLSLAVIVQAGFPSGSQQLRSKGVRPELQFASSWSMPNQNSVGAVAGVRSDVDFNSKRYATAQLGFNFSHTWNPKFFTYGEFAARQIRSASRGGKNMMYGVGGGWLPMANTQIDVKSGWGLKDNDTNLAFAVGISRRFHPPSAAKWGAKKEDPKPEQTPSATTEDGK